MKFHFNGYFICNFLYKERYYYDNRSFQLGISYKFGNKMIKAKKHKTGNENEKTRT